MLNENKIKMMTKMSIYEKNEGKRMIAAAKYYKGDYVALGVLKTLVTTTIAFLIIAVLYALCNIDSFVENISGMDYVMMGKNISVYYVLMMIVFGIVGGFVYAWQYDNTKNGLKRYFSRLNKLERFYNGQKNKK